MAASHPRLVTSSTAVSWACEAARALVACGKEELQVSTSSRGVGLSRPPICPVSSATQRRCLLVSQWRMPTTDRGTLGGLRQQQDPATSGAGYIDKPLTKVKREAPQQMTTTCKAIMKSRFRAGRARNDARCASSRWVNADGAAAVSCMGLPGAGRRSLQRSATAKCHVSRLTSDGVRG